MMTTENMIKTLRMLQKRFEEVSSRDTGGIKISYLSKDVADMLEKQNNTIESLESKINKLIEEWKEVESEDTDIEEVIDIIKPEHIMYTDIYIEPIIEYVTRCAYGSLSNKVDNRDHYIALYDILNALNRDKNKEVTVNLRQGCVNIKLSEPVEDREMGKYNSIGIYRQIPMSDIGPCIGSEITVRLNNPVRFYDNYKTGSVYSYNPSDNFRFGGLSEIILYYADIDSSMVTDISFKYTNMRHSCIKHIEKERDTNESESIEFGSDNYELNFDSIINSLRKKCADTLLSGAAINENYIKDTALLDILDKVLSDEYLVLELEPSYNKINLYPSKKIQDKSRVILPSKENGLPKFKVIYNDLDDDNKIKIQINDDTIYHFDVFNYIELCFDEKDRTMVEKITLKVSKRADISDDLDNVYETTHYNDSLIFKLDKDSLITGVNLSIVPESAFLTLFNVANAIGKLDYVEHDGSFIRLKCNDPKLNNTILLFIKSEVNFYIELVRKFDDGKVITYPFENCIIKELSTEGDVYISFNN